MVMENFFENSRQIIERYQKVKHSNAKFSLAYYSLVSHRVLFNKGVRALILEIFLGDEFLNLFDT